MKTALNSLRLIGLLEGISYLVLLAFVVNLLIVQILYKWNVLITIGAFISSLVPFGTFYADKKWFKNA
jgi:hypothetical protein